MVPADPRSAAQRALVERVLDRYDAVVAPAWPSFRAQVVHTDLTTDNALVDDAAGSPGSSTSGTPATARSSSTWPGSSTRCSPIATATSCSAPPGWSLDGYQRHVPARAAGAAAPRRAARDAGRRDHRDLVVAVRPRAGGRHVRRALQRRRSPAPSRSCSPSAGTRWPAGSGRTSTRPDRAGRPRGPTRGGHGAGHRAAQLRRPDPPGRGARRVDDRRRRAALPRRLQQRARRRPRPPARDRGHRPPGAPAEHEPALPARGRRSSSPSGWSPRCPRRASTRSSSSTPARRPTTSPGGWPRPPRAGAAGCAPTTPTTASPRPSRPSRRSPGRAAAPPTHVATLVDRSTARRGRATALAELADARPAGGRGHPRRGPDQRRLPDRRPGRGRPLAATMPAPPGRCGSPTRSRAGTAGPARRCGRSEHLGVVPDLVTLGKPMGNGHPIGAVITRREIARVFADETVFFSTFGGNPVSAAAALAVLDVLDDERVLARTTLRRRRAARAPPRGRRPTIRASSRSAASGWPSAWPAGMPRRPRRSRRGCASAACSSARPAATGDVLKVRPPLAFTVDEVPIVAEAFAATLAALPGAAAPDQSRSRVSDRRRTSNSAWSISPRA